MASADGENGGDIGTVVDILLVEPNPGDTRLFEENFRDGKLVNAVHAVENGEDALDFVYQRGEYEDKPQPDLVLIEPQLPGMSGMEFLTELKSDPELGDVPVVVLTSSRVGEQIVKSNDVEADEYMQKPVQTDEFIRFAQDVGDFWFAIVKNETGD
ncbi:response regulator [Natrarchaeobius chitinivorans]|uniref:Response regulator n=1 Tax=Natrarchaeobius chitinivorans TaxID=1679083 RepID=A0A3N6P5N5_NATCH|nr:response regulator [Natrarchaeobius chitinivorans]RQG90945.1 response regulator [Natrarchaeobius chitinivorans]